MTAGLLPRSSRADGPIIETIEALRETRFAVAFRRALARLRRRGEITNGQERQYWLAMVTAEKFEVDGKTAYFAEHLQRKCEGLARESGDFRDDLVDWWNSIVAWIVDNWETVLKVLLSLLVFLNAPVK